MSREAFLQRVREAAHAGRAFRLHHEDDLGPRTGYVGAGDDLPAAMAKEVTAVGGVAHLVEDLAAASAVLTELIEQYQPRAALCWEHELLDRLGLPDLLATHDVEAVTHSTLATLSPEAQREKTLSADIGITSADYAAAESGTLAMLARPGQERLASLAPPVHVTIIERRQILPDLMDVFPQIQETHPDGIPSNLTLITGPSKSGDIELRLTTGVHGPGKWHVVIVRE